MKIAKKQLFLGICSLLLSMGSFFVAGFAQKEVQEQIPNAVELYHPQGLALSMEEAASLSGSSFACASLGQEVSVEGGLQKQSIQGWYQMTTPTYGTLASMTFLAGSYFTESPANKEQPMIILPESAALTFFGFSTGLGQTICINQQDFLVCGVYKEGSFLTKANSAGLPIFYGNYELSSPLMAEEILLPQKQNLPAAQIVQKLQEQLEVPLDGTVLELSALRRLAEDLWRLAAIFSLFWFLLLLCQMTYRCFLKAYDSCQGTRKSPWISLLFGFLFLLLTLLGFSLLLQRITLPACYLPSKNLFDASHYFQQFLDSRQRIYTHGRIKDFSRIASGCLLFEGMFLIPAVLFFWKGCSKIKKALLRGE